MPILPELFSEPIGDDDTLGDLLLLPEGREGKAWSPEESAKHPRATAGRFGDKPSEAASSPSANASPNPGPGPRWGARSEPERAALEYIEEYQGLGGRNGVPMDEAAQAILDWDSEHDGEMRGTDANDVLQELASIGYLDEGEDENGEPTYKLGPGPVGKHPEAASALAEYLLDYGQATDQELGYVLSDAGVEDSETRDAILDHVVDLGLMTIGHEDGKIVYRPVRKEEGKSWDESKVRRDHGRFADKPTDKGRVEHALEGRFFLPAALAREAKLPLAKVRAILAELVAAGRVEGSDTGGYRLAQGKPGGAGEPAVQPDAFDLDAATSSLLAAVRHHGGPHNQADLADVRQSLANLSRAQQDAVITHARRRGLLTASAYEGREGLSERQRAAALHEEGSHSLGYLGVRKSWQSQQAMTVNSFHETKG